MQGKAPMLIAAGLAAALFGGAATAATLHVACATSPAFAELYGADGLIDDPVSGISYDNGTVRANDAPGFGVAFNPATTHFIGDYGNG